MSGLNSLFNRGTLATRCKTCLNLVISRIKLLRNKRDAQLKQMSKDIAMYLQSGQESIARIRVEHIIREQNVLAAYEIIELFCEFILARVPILEAQKECPTELQEAVATIIFASPRCSDLPELIHLRNLFATKYGKEFIAVASELRPGSNVNRTVIEKLSVRAPSPELKIKTLKAIAKEYNLEWDSSNTEAELGKSYEDLLDGSSPLKSNARQFESSSRNFPTKEDGSSPVSPMKENKSVQNHAPVHPADAYSSVAPKFFSDAKEIDLRRPVIDEKASSSRSSSDALERARAAIAAADRASAAARAAAELVKVKLHH